MRKLALRRPAIPVRWREALERQPLQITVSLRRKPAEPFLQVNDRRGVAAYLLLTLLSTTLPGSLVITVLGVLRGIRLRNIMNKVRT